MGIAKYPYVVKILGALKPALLLTIKVALFYAIWISLSYLVLSCPSIKKCVYCKSCVHMVRRNLSLMQNVPASTTTLHKTSVWGPTGDGMDKICTETLMPELDIGDWIYFENMGAYTTSCSTRYLQ